MKKTGNYLTGNKIPQVQPFIMSYNTEEVTDIAVLLSKDDIGRRILCKLRELKGICQYVK